MAKPCTTRVHGHVPLWYMVGMHCEENIFMYYVYILLMSDGKLYTGFTHDLRRRLYEHKAGKCITTKKYLPVELIFYEAYRNEEDARRRELYFKTNKGKTVLKIMLNQTLRSL